MEIKKNISKVSFQPEAMNILKKIDEDEEDDNKNWQIVESVCQFNLIF